MLLISNIEIVIEVTTKNKAVIETVQDIVFNNKVIEVTNINTKKEVIE